jgi:hypothetical protein
MAAGIVATKDDRPLKKSRAAEAEECACAQVISNYLLIVLNWLNTNCMIFCRKFAKNKSSKAVDQQPVNVQTTPPVAATSVPSPAAGTILMPC